MELDTLGPRKARQLYERLGITSLTELQRALDAGTVRQVPGFGKKTIERQRHALTEATERA
jgi:DNA polymerase (family 10)